MNHGDTEAQRGPYGRARRSWSGVKATASRALALLLRTAAAKADLARRILTAGATGEPAPMDSRPAPERDLDEPVMGVLFASGRLAFEVR